jgi:hypothetical protein
MYDSLRTAGISMPSFDVLVSGNHVHEFSMGYDMITFSAHNREQNPCGAIHCRISVPWDIFGSAVCDIRIPIKSGLHVSASILNCQIAASFTSLLSNLSVLSNGSLETKLLEAGAGGGAVQVLSLDDPL